MSICIVCFKTFKPRNCKQVTCGDIACVNENRKWLNRQFKKRKPNYFKKYMEKYKLKDTQKPKFRDLHLDTYWCKAKKGKPNRKCTECNRKLSIYNPYTICNACAIKKRQIEFNIRLGNL